MKLDLVYFAWVRERVGIPRETVETRAETVGDLIAELSKRDLRYNLAFSDLSAVRVAVDQTLAPIETPLSGAKEVAFFPPMTGG